MFSNSNNIIKGVNVNSASPSMLIKQEVPDQDEKKSSFSLVLSNTAVSLLAHKIAIKSESTDSSQPETDSQKLTPVKLESFNESFDILSDEDPDIQNSLEENLEVSLEELNEELNKDLANGLVENETTVYKCPMCDQVFKKLQEHKDHKKKHFIEKRT